MAEAAPTPPRTAAAAARAALGRDEPTQIRVQHFPGFISPFEVAAKLGYLGKLELKQVGVVTGGPESIQAVATDQTDVGGAFPSAIIKLIAAGGPVKAVIGQFGADEQAYSGLYVPEDSSIKTAKDLIGKKIGVNTLGANSEAVIHLWLKEQGLSQEELKEVELVVIPPVNMEEALKQHQLDGAIMGGAVREKAERDGGVRARLQRRRLPRQLPQHLHRPQRQLHRRPPGGDQRIRQRGRQSRSVTCRRTARRRW